MKPNRHYWFLYRKLKDKYPTWSYKQLHVVTRILGGKYIYETLA